MSEATHAGQLVNSGWSFYLAGNMPGALREFQAALQHEPEHLQALSGFIQALMAMSRWAEAGEAATRFLKLAPDVALAHRLQGEILRHQRSLVSAEKHAREALRLAPDDPVSHHFLAVNLYDQKKYAQALQIVDEGRRIDPGYAVLAAQKALILLHHKGPRAAEPVAEEALQLRDDDSYVLTNVARVMLMRGRLEIAHNLLSEVLQRDANDEEAISLYLLTDKSRYRLLRWRARFGFWRKDHGFLGWIAWLGVWGLIIAVMIAVAVAGQVPAFLVAFAYQLFWRAQYAGHRKRVKAHFAKPELKRGF